MLHATRDLTIVLEVFDPVPDSNIIIPDTVDKKKLGQDSGNGVTRRGIVTSVGPDKKEINVGMLVHFDMFGGIMVYDREREKTLIILQSHELLAVETNGEANA